MKLKAMSSPVHPTLNIPSLPNTPFDENPLKIKKNTERKKISNLILRFSILFIYRTYHESPNLATPLFKAGHPRCCFSLILHPPFRLQHMYQLFYHAILAYFHLSISKDNLDIVPDLI